MSSPSRTRSTPQSRRMSVPIVLKTALSAIPAFSTAAIVTTAIGAGISPSSIWVTAGLGPDTLNSDTGARPAPGYHSGTTMAHGRGGVLDTSQMLSTRRPCRILPSVLPFGAEAEHSALEIMERPRPEARANSDCVLCCFWRSDRIASPSGSPSPRGKFSDAGALGSLISMISMPKEAPQRRHLPLTGTYCFNRHCMQVSIITQSSRGAVRPSPRRICAGVRDGRGWMGQGSGCCERGGSATFRTHVRCRCRRCDRPARGTGPRPAPKDRQTRARHGSPGTTKMARRCSIEPE